MGASKPTRRWQLRPASGLNISSTLPQPPSAECSHQLATATLIHPKCPDSHQSTVHRENHYSLGVKKFYSKVQPTWSLNCLLNALLSVMKPTDMADPMLTSGQSGFLPWKHPICRLHTPCLTRVSKAGRPVKTRSISLGFFCWYSSLDCLSLVLIVLANSC